MVIIRQSPRKPSSDAIQLRTKIRRKKKQQKNTHFILQYLTLLYNKKTYLKLSIFFLL